MGNNKNVANYRERLRAKGFVKKEVWIPPRFKTTLKQVELALRQGILPTIPENTESEQMYDRMNALMSDLAEYMDDTDIGYDVDMILHDNGVLEFVVDGMHEFSQLLVEADDQYVVSTQLINLDEIHPRTQQNLNRALLELNNVVPLSNFSIANGSYSLDGQLSADSKTEVIMQEVVTLADNVTEALDFISDFADEEKEERFAVNLH